jgi:hypothetical protein
MPLPDRRTERIDRRRRGSKTGERTLAGPQASCHDRTMSGITTHACPYCELRFSYHNEVKDHILHDHPEHVGVVDSIEPIELPHD